METVLVTGGTGLIGRHLIPVLTSEGYAVKLLSRKKTGQSNQKIFLWDIGKNFIEEEAVTSANHIIHLAGANIARYWTSKYKQEIIKSRVQSAEMIFRILERRENKVQSFISASAVGYYGDCGETWLDENRPAGDDFLSDVCLRWEEAANKFSSLQKKVTIVRTGIVLAKEGGTLHELLKPIRFGIAPIFGDGKQFYSWIHIADLCRLYLFALRKNSGINVYHGAAPTPVRYEILVDEIARAAGKSKINFRVSGKLLKLFLGGFGTSLLNSQRCSAEKVMNEGFKFQFENLTGALKDLAGLQD